MLQLKRAPGSSRRETDCGGSLIVQVLVVSCGVIMTGFGIWGLVAPMSFARYIAFPPYNPHLLHDVGAFQIGIGAGLIAAAVWRDALGVALVGFLIADAIHTGNHVFDRHLGGHGSDPWLLAALGLVGLTALLVHIVVPHNSRKDI